MARDLLNIEIIADRPVPPVGTQNVPDSSSYVIPGEEQTEYVLPPPSNDEGAKASAEHLTTYEAVTAASRGEDPVAAHSAVSGLTPEQLTIRARQQYDETVTKGLEQLLAQSASSQGPDEFALEVEGVGAYASQVGANVSSATVPERKMVEEISRLYGDATDETEKKIINQLYFKRRMSEILFSQGYGDWAKNVAGLLIMSDESLEAGMTATGARSYTPDAVASWFSSADNWRKFVSAFAGLSAEEQVQDFEAIVSVMRDTRDDNAIKIMDHLSQLVDPTSVDSTAFWHGADKLFLAGTVAEFARVASRALRGANLAAVSKKLDNVDLAAKATRTAAADAKAADVVGTTRLDASTSHVPFDNTKILEGADPDLADEIVKQQQILNKYLELSKDLERGFLTPEEAQKAADNFVEELRNTPGITDVELVSVDGKSVTVTYRTLPSKAKRQRDKRGRFVKTPETSEELPKLTATRHFTVDDVTGELVPEDIGIVKATTKGIQSPNSLFHTNRKRLVNEPEAILREQEAMAVKFKAAMVAAFKGMSKASAQKVNAVIARGRDEERVYSYAELVGGNILTKAEFNVYASMRHLFDIAYAAENTMVRNKALAKGLREVRVGEAKEIVRPAGDVSGAKAMLRASEDQMIHISTPVDNGPTYRKATDDLIQKYYDEGYVLVRKDGGQYFAVGDNRYADFALINKADVKDLPPTMVSFRPGYAPVEYKNGVYFVKTVTRGQVGEASRAVGTTTHRYFDNITDATTFANELKVNGVTDAAGNVTKFDQTDVKILHNREMSAGELEEDRIRIFGGLYNSARKGERLKFGLGAADPELVDPVISLTRYFDSLSRSYPMHLWRIGIEQAWMNTARARWGLARDYRGTFQDAVKHISDSLSTSERAEATKSHMQLSLQMKIPTTEERAIRTWTRDLAERIETNGTSGLRKGGARALHRFDSRDPVNAVLSSGFNLVLGMWNFSTMIVQGLGVTVPMGIDPLRTALYLPRTLALGTLDQILDPTALNLSKARIGTALSQKIGGEVGLGLDELHRSWTMSGLRESVLSSNPEYEALSKGLPYDKSLLQKALSTHTIFYKTGELFNYRYSWTAAFGWWKRQPGNARRVIDTKAVDEIRARADTYILHMNRANRATNQTGAWRIPSQFTNVFFKYAEALTGKELTRKEKLTMLMSQGLLFGYAGAPMLSGLGDWAIDKMGVELNEEQKDAVRDGLLQHAVHEYLGLNIDVAGRASIMKGLYEDIHGMLLGGESLGEVAAGAAGGIIGKRAAETLSALYNLGRVAPPATEDIAPDIWQAAVDATLDMASSWRNLSAAREISTNRLFKSRKGDILIRLEEGEINMQTKIAMALGLNHSDLNKIYLSSMNKLDDNKRMQEKGSAIIKTIDRILSVNDAPHNDPKRREIINLVTGAMMENETVANQKKIRSYVLNKVLSPTTQEDRLRKGQLEELYNEGILFGGPTAPSYLEQ